VGWRVGAKGKRTVRLPENNAVDDVGAAVAPRVPRVLERRERAPVERRVGVRDVRRERLRYGEGGLGRRDQIR
jgi:hypothetical protein